MFSALSISSSGLYAQRVRMDAIAANIANADVPVDPSSREEPFSERMIMLAPGGQDGSPLGVHVAGIASRKAFILRNEPWHPFADADGFVKYADIDPVVQQANALLAARNYDANLAAAQASKSMIEAAISLLA